MRVSEHHLAHLRRLIRDMLAIDPLISMTGIKRELEKKLNRSDMDLRFIKKLIRSVTGEMTVVADREKVESRITVLRERNRVIIEELFRIAFPSPLELNKTNVTERRKALEAIARIENSQVKLEMDLGLFTRHIGEINLDHRMKPIDPQTHLNIINAFGAWGMSAPEMRKVEIREATVLKNETAKPPTKDAAAAPGAKPPTKDAAAAPGAKPPTKAIPIITSPGLVSVE